MFIVRYTPDIAQIYWWETKNFISVDINQCWGQKNFAARVNFSCVGYNFFHILSTFYKKLVGWKGRESIVHNLKDQASNLFWYLRLEFCKYLLRVVIQESVDTLSY